ncbi:MAG TPA: twin-arginine translocase subunit TatC [Alphaproteobacteria bacterium]|nr:twin-arginine translocase subunit TatC [Alphaproteobacteria bacterium]
MTAHMPREEEEALHESTRAPLIDHLIELRQRLLYSLVALVVTFLCTYYFAEEIFGFLVEPLATQFEGQEGRRMIYTSLTETFFTYIKVAFFAALFISFPIIANQLYKFMAPGLYSTEKRAFLPYLVASPVLFFLGGAMVYYAIFPLAWSFFLSFETAGAAGGLPIQLEAKVGEYLSLVMKLIFAFGLFFQMPVALTLCARAGLVSAATLAKRRKYAVVILFALAAILTPPDVISQLGLALPGLVLYEISIYLARMVERQRAEREAEYENE